MIKIIAGQKGKGKTKHLIEKANLEATTENGSLVYIDKNAKHMYELNNKIRLINATEYPIYGSSELLGFICGLISGNHDITDIYIDSFLTLCNIDISEDITESLKRFSDLSERFSKNFVLSISRNENELPEEYKKNVIVSL